VPKAGVAQPCRVHRKRYPGPRWFAYPRAVRPPLPVGAGVAVVVEGLEVARPLEDGHGSQHRGEDEPVGDQRQDSPWLVIHHDDGSFVAVGFRHGLGYLIPCLGVAVGVTGSPALPRVHVGSLDPDRPPKLREPGRRHGRSALPLELVRRCNGVVQHGPGQLDLFLKARSPVECPRFHLPRAQPRLRVSCAVHVISGVAAIGAERRGVWGQLRVRGLLVSAPGCLDTYVLEAGFIPGPLPAASRHSARHNSYGSPPPVIRPHGRKPLGSPSDVPSSPAGFGPHQVPKVPMVLVFEDALRSLQRRLDGIPSFPGIVFPIELLFRRPSLQILFSLLPRHVDVDPTGPGDPRDHAVRPLPPVPPPYSWAPPRWLLVTVEHGETPRRGDRRGRPVRLVAARRRPIRSAHRGGVPVMKYCPAPGCAP
jgi:hypothetical protein